MRCAKRGPGAFFSCAGIFMRLEDILPFLPPGLLPDSLYYFYICCVSVVRAAIACLYSWKASEVTLSLVAFTARKPAKLFSFVDPMK